MNWNKIIECVPNFSEGRDLEKIDKIVAPFRGKSGVKLLDYSNDEDPYVVWASNLLATQEKIAE